ncbi:DinB family protein [Streptomyces griseus]|uniref:DinB family protein n=1 Tax=Streptomyces griseus TaxID=1911 RepID=UPI000564E123|nr:DinB family protein [Streptomyces griseus]
MTVPPCDLLRGQFDLTWALFEYHLDRLTPEDFLWEPAPHCWTMHRSAEGEGEGAWVPDWADTEPEPVPVPTIGWLSWHIGWWWGVTLDHLRGDPPRERTEVAWPGPGKPTTDLLRDLRTAWLTTLADLSDTDLGATASFPWPNDPGHTVADTLAWANAELMKNAAEIGQLRLLRAAVGTEHR